MKTLTFITRTISVAIIVVLMSTNLEAQKAYHKATLENGITELNNMANRLIEKCKVKFDIQNTVSVSEMESANEASSENELNAILDQLSINAKFDVNNTISVIETGAAYNELDREADEMMANLKFDVDQTLSVSEEMAENSGLDQMTDAMMANLKFEADQTLLVTDSNEESAELDQLTDQLMASNVTFDVNKTNTIQDEQVEMGF